MKSIFDIARKLEPKKTPRFIKDFSLLLEAKVSYRKYKKNISGLKLIGITGTDGKTTTSAMIYEVLKNAGMKVGLINTISAKIGDEDLDTGFHVTTPSPKNLFKYLSMMKEKGIDVVVLEITSHGIAQNRVHGLKLDAAVFTNITNNEHLDYFKTYENYLNVKAELISKKYLKPGGLAVINEDDESFHQLLAISQKRDDINVSLYKMSDALKNQLKVMEFPQFSVEASQGYFVGVPGRDIKLKILGFYNIYNALAAYAVGSHFKVNLDVIAEGLSNMMPPEGRMNVLQKRPFYLIVDFAHTPNALKEALKSARNLVTKGSKLICIFGCASERDETKRPIMGQIAYDLADIVLLVPEDPRNEPLTKINKEIIGDLNSSKFVCFDEQSIKARSDAIAYAVNELARNGDVIIALGKGHEKTMNFGGVEYPWNDADEMKKYVKIAAE